jgi:hypothetical protein
VAGADLRRDLRLHQLARDQTDRLAQEIAGLTREYIGNDIGNGHAVTLGHRGAPFVDRLASNDESGTHGGRTTLAQRPREPLHHFYRRDLRVDGLRTYFVVPGKAGTICLFYASGSGSDLESGGTCADATLLRSQAIYLSEAQPDGTSLVSLLLSDGYSEIKSGGARAEVRNNVAILHGATDVVTATGPGTAPATIELGPQTPPRVAQPQNSSVGPRPTMTVVASTSR